MRNSVKADKIRLSDALDNPAWMMVWAAEPHRRIDVTMSYDNLKIIYDLINKWKGHKKPKDGE